MRSGGFISPVSLVSVVDLRCLNVLEELWRRGICADESVSFLVHALQAHPPPKACGDYSIPRMYIGVH